MEAPGSLEHSYKRLYCLAMSKVLKKTGRKTEGTDEKILSLNKDDRRAKCSLLQCLPQSKCGPFFYAQEDEEQFDCDWKCKKKTHPSEKCNQKKHVNPKS